MASPGVSFDHGKTTGTGASISITTRFGTPKYIKILNETDPGTLEWIAGMPDASGYRAITDGTISVITSAGITPTAAGFDLAADTEINASGDIIRWIAWA